VSSDRLEEAFEGAGGDDDVLSAERLKDALADAAAWFADGFHEVGVAMAAGDLFHDEHADVVRWPIGLRQRFRGPTAKMFSLHSV
jgi:hypothetical protein